VQVLQRQPCITKVIIQKLEIVMISQVQVVATHHRVITDNINQTIINSIIQVQIISNKTKVKVVEEAGTTITIEEFLSETNIYYGKVDF
jgi:hypothetical protein